MTAGAGAAMFILLGAMAFPWVIGQASEHYGLRAGMMLPLIGAVMIVALVSVISRQKGER
jgi:hypothetical protein